MELTKLHGLGNDYLYLDTVHQDLSGFALPELARVLSDRHFGVGSDGIILVQPAEAADFRMRIFNSDGSEAEMCGNGVRGFAKYVYDRGLTDRTHLRVETGAGIIELDLQVQGGVVTAVRADLGRPRLARREIPMRGEPAGEPVLEESLVVAGQDFALTAVSMDNPHCVLFVPEVNNFPVAQIGPLLEHHELFPHRTNVEFVRVVDRGHLQMRVWERGAGETLACGTGAAAAAVAGALTERSDRQVIVHLRGGDLELEWTADDHVLLTGPAAEVFTATVTEEVLAPARV